MSVHEALSTYPTAMAVRVAALVLLVFALRALVLPFALVTVLLDRAQRALSVVVTTPPAGPSTSRGGEWR